MQSTINWTGMLLVGIVVTFSTFCHSQQHATGTQPFGTFGGGPDIINLGNLNVHLNIPVLHKQGRGLPFIYDLAYDSSSVWMPVTSNGSTSWSPRGGFGWPPPTTAVGYIPAPSSFAVPLVCPPNYIHFTLTTRHYPGYVDGQGTFHHAPVSTVTSSDQGCSASSGGTGKADDGSGYTVTISAGNAGSAAVMHPCRTGHGS
jgi:hypothetical protein